MRAFVQRNLWGVPTLVILVASAAIGWTMGWPVGIGRLQTGLFSGITESLQTLYAAVISGVLLTIGLVLIRLSTSGRIFRIGVATLAAIPVFWLMFGVSAAVAEAGGPSVNWHGTATYTFAEPIGRTETFVVTCTSPDGDQNALDYLTIAPSPDEVLIRPRPFVHQGNIVFFGGSLDLRLYERTETSVSIDRNNGTARFHAEVWPYETTTVRWPTFDFSVTWDCSKAMRSSPQ